MSDAPKAIAIDAAEDVEVHLDDSSDDEKFTVTVRKGGEDVETHADLTADTIESIESEHFSVSTIEPPSAPPEVSDADAPEGEPPQDD